jgi:hypothetical protein
MKRQGMRKEAIWDKNMGQRRQLKKAHTRIKRRQPGKKEQAIHTIMAQKDSHLHAKCNGSNSYVFVQQAPAKLYIHTIDI